MDRGLASFPPPNKKTFRFLVFGCGWWYDRSRNLVTSPACEIRGRLRGRDRIDKRQETTRQLCHQGRKAADGCKPCHGRGNIGIGSRGFISKWDISGIRDQKPNPILSFFLIIYDKMIRAKMISTAFSTFLPTTHNAAPKIICF